MISVIQKRDIQLLKAYMRAIRSANPNLQNLEESIEYNEILEWVKCSSPISLLSQDCLTLKYLSLYMCVYIYICYIQYVYIRYIDTHTLPFTIFLHVFVSTVKAVILWNIIIFIIVMLKKMCILIFLWKSLDFFRYFWCLESSKRTKCIWNRNI